MGNIREVLLCRGTNPVVWLGPQASPLVLIKTAEQNEGRMVRPVA
jgi:hypothetical protein